MCCKRKGRLDCCRQCSMQERQESKQGSSGRLVRFSNHLIYTRDCFSLRVPQATGLAVRENSRSHTHDIPCRFPHHWKGSRYVLNFCFFGKLALNEVSERFRILGDLRPTCPACLFVTIIFPQNTCTNKRLGKNETKQ